MKKVVIIILAVVVVIGICVGIALGVKGGNSKVELDTAEISYTYPYSSPIWKNYKVNVGYPKNENWVVEEGDGSFTDLKIKDETRNLTIEFKAKQVSKNTWEQNSKLRKESYEGTDKTWKNGLEGFCYDIGTLNYCGWIFLGNPTSIESGKKGDNVDYIEFTIKTAGSSDEVVSMEEMMKIMDEDIIPNISWEEID